MDEIEVPLEAVQEHIHEAAHKASHSDGGHEDWISKIALFSAIIAVFAAIAALMAGHNSNEAMIKQIKASDSWSFYQAKGIKSAILSTRNELVTEMGKKVSEKEEQKLEDYKKQQEDISEKAKELEHESEHHLAIHETFASSVTLFQIAITIAAITILTRRKKFFFVSFGFSLLALVFFVQALLK